GDAEVAGDGRITMPGDADGSGIGGTGENNINDAIGAINETANAGWNLATDDGAEATVAPGGKVTFAGGDDNIEVTNTVDAEGNPTVNVGLSDEVNVGTSITVGDPDAADSPSTTVDNGGVTVISADPDKAPV